MALVISLAAVHIIFMPLDSSNFSYNTIHRNQSIIRLNATDIRQHNQSFLLDDQTNDTFVIQNDHANQQNNSTTIGNSHNTSHTGNKMSDNVLISSHLNKDLDLYDKAIAHIHSQERGYDDISNERKR